MKRCFLLLVLLLAQSACAPYAEEVAALPTIAILTPTLTASPPPAATQETIDQAPPTPTSGGVQACVTAHSLNLRQGPGKEFPAVGVILKGECVFLLSRTADAAWVQSERGWLTSFYLQFNSDLMAIPVFEVHRTAGTKSPIAAP